jgi:hypothetical protein
MTVVAFGAKPKEIVYQPNRAARTEIRRLVCMLAPILRAGEQPAFAIGGLLD